MNCLRPPVGRATTRCSWCRTSNGKSVVPPSGRSRPGKLLGLPLMPHGIIFKFPIVHPTIDPGDLGGRGHAGCGAIGLARPSRFEEVAGERKPIVLTQCKKPLILFIDGFARSRV
jgi:hypothetical protein